MVGRTLAAGLHGLGNDVVIGTRDPAATLVREGTDGFGTWAAAHPDVSVATFAEAARGADLVVNALSGEVSAAGIEAAQVAPERCCWTCPTPSTLPAASRPTCS